MLKYPHLSVRARAVNVSFTPRLTSARDATTRCTLLMEAAALSSRPLRYIVGSAPRWPMRGSLDFEHRRRCSWWKLDQPRACSRRFLTCSQRTPVGRRWLLFGPGPRRSSWPSRPQVVEPPPPPWSARGMLLVEPLIVCATQRSVSFMRAGPL